MNLSFSDEHLAFRDEVRAFLNEAMPEAIAEKTRTGAQFDHAEIMAWHKVLYEKGWVAPDWPEEHGGTGWDLTRRHIFHEETALAGAPRLSPFGLAMIGPLLMRFGTDAQKERFLPKILSGEEIWCQGYSEPNAGSDLASLKLRAEDDGDHYVLNGQKTWTTHGQYADWIFLLVRTDSSGKKQEGITFLLVDIKGTPGVTVKPFLNISGHTAFADTYFEDARVPKDNRVGGEGEGWTLAKALLGHERTLIAGVPETRRTLNMVRRIASETPMGEGTVLDDPRFRRRLAALAIRHRALEMTNLRALADAAAGGHPGAESSVLKIRGSELWQAVHELALTVMGPDSLAWIDSGEVVPADRQAMTSNFNYVRAATIYGGSNEIQRNILAKVVLGLPDGRRR